MRRVFQSANPAQAELALPVYPQAMLGTAHAWAVIGIRITIDAHGAVTDTSLSPMVPSLPGSPAPAFLEAVQTATAQWRFHPAAYIVETYSRTPSGSLDWKITGVEPSESVTDLRFTFTGAGQVQLGR